MLNACYIALIGFLTYTAVFAYRKPYTVALFEGVDCWGVPYQTLLIICQGVGYMVSKFVGISFIASLQQMGRWKQSAAFIGLGWLSMLIFALVPAPWGMICLFVNGFAMGFMWGIVFSYVEGRRATDFIGASLAVSFIFAGGFTRSVAVWLRDAGHVQEAWLGFATGAVFLLPLIVLLILMEHIPSPNNDDIEERTQRLPMDAAQRKSFFKQFRWGIVAFTVTYLFLTILRDIRDNFMSNLWNELGYGKKPALFTQTETVTSIIVLLLMSLLVFIRNNRIAFRWAHVIIIAGFLVAGISSFLFMDGLISGMTWMQWVGLGLYMGYVPFNCVYFERMIATFKVKGNVGFLIYIADSFGYFASMAVFLSKEILYVS